MNFLSPIKDFFEKILKYVFNLVTFSLRKLRFAGHGVRVEDKVTDFFEIFKITWVFFIFNILALLVFTVLPQGKDVILIVIEDLSNYDPKALITLIISLMCWCVVSEFGVRYKIYVTDSSGFSLSDERVNFRKEAQRFVSSIYLLLPVFIVIISVIVVAVSNVKKWEAHDTWPFIVVVLLLVLTFTFLSKYYLDDFYIAAKRKKGVWYKIREVELQWASKLFGIYNDHVFMVRKASNFKDLEPLKDDKGVILLDDKKNPKLDLPPDMDVKYTYQRFTEIIDRLREESETNDTQDIQNFPRNYLKNGEMAPLDFKEVTFKPDNFSPKFNDEHLKDKTQPEFINVPNEDGYYRWIYKCNTTFYKTLHLQVHIISISALVFLLFMSLNPFYGIYKFIGSPALVCWSFACWLGIYTGLLYIDSRFKKKIRISVRWLLVLWLFIASFINKDHPVRNNGDAGFGSSRPLLSAHFNSWLSSNFPDTLVMERKDSCGITVDSQLVYNKPMPVYFITAEGGALRTGAFAAMLLAKLQDKFPEFKKHIYAFSTVSGGTVGISFFNAISYLEPNTKTNDTGYYRQITNKFFSKDQLSPTLAKFFYGDVLNNFLTSSSETFDRGIAIERSWEQSYAEVFNRTADKNVYSTNFLSSYNCEANKNKFLPAWFINTTEVESGLQCYISNVIADGFVAGRQRDLLQEKIRYGINYSTAVNFSARFPLFSPSAALYQNDEKTYHYVDGGYVENTGSKTMLEIIQRLHNQIASKNIKPYVIRIRFSNSDSSAFASTGFLNEVSSILSGIINTRAGAATTYSELLQKEVHSLGGEVIDLPLSKSGKEVPMSWVFSKRSMDNLVHAVNEFIPDTIKIIPNSLRLPEFKDSKVVN